MYFQASDHQSQEKKDPLLPLIEEVIKVSEKVAEIEDGLVRVVSYLLIAKLKDIAALIHYRR